MISPQLKLYPGAVRLDRPHMVLGLSGWMDGGEVSVGTLECLIEKLEARRVAEIDPEGFYIYNFPGSMETSALFRPYVELEDGIINEYVEPTNRFFCDEGSNLVLFVGKEPNLNWRSYADCILGLAQEYGVEDMYFIGSVAGLVPHTREPRISSVVSDPEMKNRLAKYHVSFSDYRGPASIVTYLTQRATRENIRMATLVAEIPAYVQGRNPKCIEAMTRRLAKLLGLEINLDDLRIISEELEKKLDTVVKKRQELSNYVKMMEENYDKQVFDTEMGDLKQWLEQQGIRLD